MRSNFWFDEIAKAAAADVPRREMLRRLLIGLAGGTAAVLLPKRAEADPPPCTSPASCEKTSECCPGELCRDGKCESVPCGQGGRILCGSQCCQRDEICCAPPVITGPDPPLSCFPASPNGCPISDRNQKEEFAPVSPQDVLERLNGISIESWNYRFQDRSIRHIGPMAQDFRAAFGVGEDERHINLIDASGVALSAIQGLYQMVQQKDTELEAIRSQNAALAARLAALEQALTSTQP